MSTLPNCRVPFCDHVAQFLSPKSLSNSHSLTEEVRWCVFSLSFGCAESSSSLMRDCNSRI